MIKTISYWSVRDGLKHTRDPLEAIDDAKAAGFAAIELAVAEKGPLTPSTDQPTCEKYRTAAADRGLVLQTLASGMSWACCPTHPDPAVRKKSIQLHADALQRAAWLGCQAMLFVPGAVRVPWDPAFAPVPYENAITWAKEAVSQLLPLAHKLSIDLCLENVWNGLLLSPLEWRDLIDSYNSPHLGMYFDVGNYLAYHQYPPHWITLLGKRIKRVHIKDYSSTKGFVDLLAGDVPWQQTIAALRQVGYDRTLVAEMMPYDDTLLERTSRAMDQILTM
ncbi:MAG: sugar phosphate isomerase/epimerase [Phycisphaeraceae bacterium]|nr:sugar phosphate isomerase/epimerase [Phycisphaeraceae bacterium]